MRRGRPPPFVPGEVDRTSRQYRLGREIAEHVIDVRPGDLDHELYLHDKIIREADSDPRNTPYPGQYDGWHGFADRVREHLTERNRA